MVRLDFDTPRDVKPFPDVSARSREYRERHAAQRKADVERRLALPAPRTSATETDVAADYVPRGVRTVAKMLDRHGWRWRLTRAVGPRVNTRGEVVEAQCATLCIAAVGPGRRIIWTWRYEAAGQSWKFEDALVSGEGVMTSTQASRLVKGGAS